MFAKEGMMNFRSRNVISLMATGALLLSTSFSLLSANAAEPLSIVGPQGQVSTTAKQYGPIKASETLWSIAQKVKPHASLTTYQVMAALFDANPQAFSNRNFNSLIKGAKLAIPTQAAMEQYPSAATTQAKKTTLKPVTTQSKAKTEVTQTKEASTQTASLSSQLQKAESINQRLSAELVKAKDGLVLAQSDNQELKSTIAELKKKVVELNTQLKASLLQSAKQKQAFEATQEQAATLTKSLQASIKASEQASSKPPSTESQSLATFWQNLMNRPVLLAVFVIGPALLLIILFSVWYNRKEKESDEGQASASEGGQAAEQTEQIIKSESNEVPLQNSETPLLDEQHTRGVVQLDSNEPAKDLTALESEQENALSAHADIPAEKDTAIDELWAEVIEAHDDEIETDKAALNQTQGHKDERAPFETESFANASSNEGDAATMSEQDAAETNNITQTHWHTGSDNPVQSKEASEEQSQEHIPFGEPAIDDDPASLHAPLSHEAMSFAKDHGQEYAHNEPMLPSDVSDKIVAELDGELPQAHAENDADPSFNQDDELHSLLAEFDNVEPISKEGTQQHEEADAGEMLSRETPTLAKDPAQANSRSVSDERIPDTVIKENVAQQVAMTDPTADIDALLDELEDEVVIVDPKHQAADVDLDESRRPEQEGDRFEEENSFIDINTPLDDEPKHDKGRVDPFFDSNMAIDELEDSMSNETVHDPKAETGTQSMADKLNLARAYMDIDDKDSARALLKEVGVEGDEQQRREAGALLNELVGL
ncbi:FimV/HubP family polar landmark protein [uncultured Shewanella sp.]|uniref:FimV/HubP family polar landmark protein n=1 Tax=uncultured Shewanella sp. TaxID=173975 RepID=UPI002616B635|nr:FimV/HubP family polar landmark protein [uncultured Shewanella sp.]